MMLKQANQIQLENTNKGQASRGAAIVPPLNNEN